MDHYVNYSDSILLTLLKNGDEAAFTTIYNRYWEKLLFVAGTKFRELSMAEEMVQDIFLDLWNRRATLQIDGKLESYLAVAMKYKVINAQARLKKLLEYQKAEAHKNLHDNSTNEWLSFQELKHKLSVHVSSLPEKCRITYQLSREHGLSQKEIARHMQVSEKAVEANLSRALKSLKKALNHTPFLLAIICSHNFFLETCRDLTFSVALITAGLI